jgi:hypothetical protein
MNDGARIARAALAAAAVLLAAASGAQARPMPYHAAAKKKGQRYMPLRVVVVEGARRVANCVFATTELPEAAPSTAPKRGTFDAGDPIWGRCYLPDKPGPSRARELVDYITVDGKPAWEQAYDRPLPSEAISRSVPYSDVLRTLLASLKRGPHRVEIVGKLRRAGKPVTLYRGDFRFVK